MNWIVTFEGVREVQPDFLHAKYWLLDHLWWLGEDYPQAGLEAAWTEVQGWEYNYGPTTGQLEFRIKAGDPPVEYRLVRSDVE